MLCGEQTQKISEGKKRVCAWGIWLTLSTQVDSATGENWCVTCSRFVYWVIFLGCISHVSDGVNRGCKMKPDEPTPGTKPVLKEQRQRKQSGQRKEEKEAAENE